MTTLHYNPQTVHPRGSLKSNTVDSREENQGVVALARQSLKANDEHLEALKSYAQTLEAELETLDKLLDDVNTVDESDLDIGSSVTIPGSVRAIAPVAIKELLSPESSFHDDALKRSRYQSFSEVRPMKPKELEALAGAVRAESYRKYALDVQKSGFTTFLDLDAQAAQTPALDTDGIDWDRIAGKVSAVSAMPRTARECEIRWVGEQHPKFNHGPWSKEEVLKVESLAAEFTDGRPDWVTVADRLGTKRMPLDCMRHAIPRKVHQWTMEADERLLKAVRMYGHNNWHLVACYVSEDATASQCSTRFEKTLDKSLKRSAWSPEEDARLSAAVTAYGSSWVDVAANIPGRHNDQCRDRWNEQVNPRINKNQWSEGEDRLLLDYICEHENTSWRDISEHLSTGRTEAMCRNRCAVLQKGANAVSAMVATGREDETHVPLVDQASVPSDSTTQGSDAFIFGSAFPNVHSSATPAPPNTEIYHQNNEIVFLEPVVSSNPEPQEFRGLQLPTRFKMAAVGDIRSASTTTSPPKKRKTRSRIVKSNKPVVETHLEPTS